MAAETSTKTPHKRVGFRESPTAQWRYARPKKQFGSHVRRLHPRRECEVYRARPRPSTGLQGCGAHERQYSIPHSGQNARYSAGRRRQTCTPPTALLGEGVIVGVIARKDCFRAEKSFDFQVEIVEEGPRTHMGGKDSRTSIAFYPNPQVLSPGWKSCKAH